MQHDISARPAGGLAARLPLGSLIALLALTLYVGAPALAGFDGLFGQDPFGYYDYATQILARARMFHLPAPYYWPLGYPALVAGGFAIVGATPLVAQTVSALAGAGVVALVYAQAYELMIDEQDVAPRFVATVAALLTLGCGQLWLWSVSIMADTAALFWATLAAWALVRYGRAVQLRWLLLAAFALTWALLSRWLYGVLLLPFAAFWLLGARERLAASGRRSPVVHGALAVLVGLLVLAPQIVVSAAAPQIITGHQWLVGWSPLNAVQRSFATPDGVANYPLPVALFYAKAAGSPRLLVPLFTPLLLIGAGALLRRRRTAALLLGWGGVVYGLLCGIPYQNFRFTLALLPPIAISTAYGLSLVWRWAVPVWRKVVLAYLALGLLVGIVYNAGVLGEQFARKQADLAVTRWVEAQVGPSDRVLAFELTLTLQHYTRLDIHELFNTPTENLKAFAADKRPTFLLVDVADIEGQWAGLAPQQRYHWLRDGPGLTKLGSQGSYTLFRVQK